MLRARRSLPLLATGLAAVLALAPSARAEVIWAVGDGAAVGPKDDQVAAMIGSDATMDNFLYLGDVYVEGTWAEFQANYEPTWGAFKAKTRPTPGNHEWFRRAEGYDPYWGAAYSAPHYYSFDVGGWHLISLNSEESSAPGSAQLDWLNADLAAHPEACTIAYWHQPRFARASTGEFGPVGGSLAVSELWNALAGKAALVLNGHLHNYQRTFAISGTTQFIVGTGGEGDGHHPFISPSNFDLAAANDTDHGALRVVLSANTAAYEFRALDRAADPDTDPDTLDSGTITCKSAPVVSTSSASAVTTQSATVPGTVNPGNLATTYRFDYGKTTSYGSQATQGSLSWGRNTHSVSASLAGLEPGTTYNYRLRATNSLGTGSGANRTLLTTPLITDTDPDPPSNDNNPRVKGSAAAIAGSTVRIYADPRCTGTVLGSGTGATFAGSGIPLTVALPADAVSDLRATVTEGANTSPCSAPFAYSEDSTPPDTSIDSGPSGVTNDSTPTFGFSETQGGVSFACRVDSGAFSPCSSPHTTAQLSDGPHTFEVRAVDAAANADPSPAIRSFSVDTAAPAAPSITDTDPDSPANDNSPEVKGNAEAGSTVSIYASADCSGAPLATGSASQFGSPGLTVAVPGDATTNLRASATDAAGNASGCSAPFAYAEDSTAPATPSITDTEPDSPANDNSPEVKGNAEAGSTVSVYASADCSGAPLATGSASQFGSPGLSVAVLDDATTDLRASATDAAGNVSSCSAPFAYTEDSTPAETVITSGPPAATNDPQPLFTFSSSTPGASFQCSLDQGSASFGPCSGPGAEHRADTPLADGDYTFRVRAIDPAANVDPSPAEQTFSVDTTAPETAVESGPAGATNEARPGFAFSSTAMGATFECSVDQGAPDFRPCSGPGATHRPPEPLADGDYVFRVRSADELGNFDSSPAERAFSVDTAAPETEITSAPASSSKRRVRYRFVSPDAQAGFECSLDRGPFTPCASPARYRVGVGRHRFAVRAVDAVGNADPTPARDRFRRQPAG